ncbi:hypothetical protein N665_3652s0003 [Sinapis alba]|nr:hypothetical protein N665_3652s0003 [Sinapis alba]
MGSDQSLWKQGNERFKSGFNTKLMWLATGDRILTWNAGGDYVCVLCQDPLKTRDHLFFECSYSAIVWSLLIGALLESSFTTKWSELMELIMDTSGGLQQTFLTHYALQASINSIWRERNERRHGGVPVTTSYLAKQIDRQVRKICLSFRQQGNF